MTWQKTGPRPPGWADAGDTLGVGCGCKSSGGHPASQGANATVPFFTTDGNTTPASAEGERRKLAAHALHAARRSDLVRAGRRALLLAMLQRESGTATADDVRARVQLPAGVAPVCLGVVPGELARAGIIRAAGYTVTARPEAHARPVKLWALADRAAALGWLSTHPEPVGVCDD